MTSLPRESLPPAARIACETLKERLQEALGPELVALWAYGAQTFPDVPMRPGAIDTHALLSHNPDTRTAVLIDEIHDRIARDLGIEWDSWYILRKDAMCTPTETRATRESVR
jgi:hypothetical protein